ncbi:High-affinity nickel-transporter [Actinomadura barringtoniae]|uniref:High-affinity nickel-transporter n=1 Tax=Actinomadura barringtoniae TaxID=1427535 RepID=A0A939PBB2_9ACTN|nr:High-affinity nickel-transporter [Actinomadura barringtoniae]MBO2449637.1 High-affinity nickel-transporter [Actinomadura barringtoniae]
MIVPAVPPAVVAHPLGNFSVNHYDGLQIGRDRIVDNAIVDFAEIPTLQDDAVASDDPAAICTELSRSLRASAAGRPLTFRTGRSALTYRPGAAGLRTSRVTCELTAPAHIDDRTNLTFTNAFRADRVGWREITATAVDVRLTASTAPGTSVSKQLMSYPRDLLGSPLDERSARITAEPGHSTAAAPAHALPAANDLERLTGPAAHSLDDIIGANRVTPLMAGLALLLATALGAAHALLPGHGKTVMATYLAARQGRPRDAAIVGATVTLTHTAGVLLIGLLLTLSSLAGDSVVQWLGVASGALIAAVGAALLTSARRRRHQHTHGHTHTHTHTHRANLLGLGIAGGLVPSPSALVVLLGAVALGRTAFGVAAVVSYGAGMAATLTAAGLLVLRVRSTVKLGHHARKLGPYGALLTGGLILLAGTAIAARNLGALL